MVETEASIWVDGGINAKTGRIPREAGADGFVGGSSSVFSASVDDYGREMAALRLGLTAHKVASA